MFYKIQPEQINLHTFSSSSGDISFTQATKTVVANLSRDLSGTFNFGGLTVGTAKVVSMATTDDALGTAASIGSAGSNNISGDQIGLVACSSVNGSGVPFSMILCDGATVDAGSSEIFSVLTDTASYNNNNNLVSINVGVFTPDSGVGNSTAIGDGVSTIAPSRNRVAYFNFLNGYEFGGTGDAAFTGNISSLGNILAAGNITGDTGTFNTVTVLNGLSTTGNLSADTGTFNGLISSGNINAAGNILAGGNITGNTGTFNVLISNREVVATGVYQGATKLIDLTLNKLIDTGSQNSLNWLNRTLSDTGGVVVAKWNSAGMEITGSLTVTGDISMNGSSLESRISLIETGIVNIPMASATGSQFIPTGSADTGGANGDLGIEYDGANSLLYFKVNDSWYRITGATF